MLTVLVPFLLKRWFNAGPFL